VDAILTDPRMTDPSVTPRQPVLFVTRKYPPSVGGMETLAHAVYRALEASADPTLIALGRSQRHLPWFLPYAAARTRRIARGPTTRLVFGDALAYTAIRPTLAKSAPPVTVMVHGLDMTFRLRPYRALVRSTLPRADRVVANSRSTAEIAVSLGVDPDRCVVLNPGVEVPEAWADGRDDARKHLLHRFGLPPEAVVLITLGRLVARKGVGWFVTEVMPGLPENVVLLVAGSGPESETIQKAIDGRGLRARVKVLGSVDGGTRTLLFGGCDAFVMPNVPVENDVEGFGLVAIEAAMAGALVIAARLEGILDAVTDGETGVLCEPADPVSWRAQIIALAEDLPAAHQAAATYAVTARERSSLARMTAEVPAALGLID
jgi:phosphatidyl-myo-inositol dimannoside synthase